MEAGAISLARGERRTAEATLGAELVRARQPSGGVAGGRGVADGGVIVVVCVVRAKMLQREDQIQRYSEM